MNATQTVGTAETMRLFLVARPYLPLESPLEEQFLAALAYGCHERGCGLFADKRPLTQFVGDDDVLVTLQAAIATYRVDFHLATRDGKTLIVECDGYTYHDGAGESQSTYDRGRDRTFTEMGLRFMRFTGREIRRQPQECVTQALRCLAAGGVAR